MSTGLEGLKYLRLNMTILGYSTVLLLIGIAILTVSPIRNQQLLTTKKLTIAKVHSHHSSLQPLFPPPLAFPGPSRI